MVLPIFQTISDLRQKVAAWRRDGQIIGFAPTMGALHAGHMQLVKSAFAAGCDRVIVSIFVNPLQFGPDEDFAAYPRSEQKDAEFCESHAVSAIFAPLVEELYPNDFLTKVDVPSLANIMCGVTRSTHFSGVATVVTKLLNQVRADKAFFGEKDYQQLLIIRRLATDLDIETEIIGVPTVREPDGLAVSSRNKYLTDKERAVAFELNSSLKLVALAVKSNVLLNSIVKAEKSRLEHLGFNTPEYLEVREANTLELIERGGQNLKMRVFGAAYLGKARLIDNVAV